jgi:hypothetical protein
MDLLSNSRSEPEMLDRRTGQRRDATRAPIQARNGWRPHGRRLGQPATPCKDCRNFVQTMGSTSLIYRFKQQLRYLLLKKHRTRKRMPGADSKFSPRCVPTASDGPWPSWYNSARPWLLGVKRSWPCGTSLYNGITEGFHNKMELINRQAYGLRNFENYRLRVKVLWALDQKRGPTLIPD